MQAEHNRKGKKARQVRNVIVTVVLSTAIAAPFLTQPADLGLQWAPSAQPQSEAKTGASLTEETTVSSQEKQRGSMLEPAERILIQEDLIYRQSDATHAADVQEDETEDPEPAEVREDQSEEAASQPDDIIPVEEFEPVWLDVDFPLYVEADVLNLRESPSTDSEILARLDMATKVECVGMKSTWARVLVDDWEGYVALEYTSREMVFAPVEQTRYVDASSLNMREKPHTDSAIITQLSNMQKITRTGVGHDWSRVRTSDGKDGYVASEYLTSQGPPPPPPPTPTRSNVSSGGSAPANPSGNRVVDVAYQAMGVPYVYAGSSMSGMDCSGFTSWVYRQIGINLPRSSRSYTSVGTGVSYSNAQPGDILVMDARRSRDGQTVASHVGIYIGGGRMIHASTSNQQITTISVNAMLNWGARLISVRRISG